MSPQEGGPYSLQACTLQSSYKQLGKDPGQIFHPPDYKHWHGGHWILEEHGTCPLGLYSGWSQQPPCPSPATPLPGFIGWSLDKVQLSYLKCMKVMSPHLANIWNKRIEKEDGMCFSRRKAVNNRIHFRIKMSYFLWFLELTWIDL